MLADSMVWCSLVDAPGRLKMVVISIEHVGRQSLNVRIFMFFWKCWCEVSQKQDQRAARGKVDEKEGYGSQKWGVNHFTTRIWVLRRLGSGSWPPTTTTSVTICVRILRNVPSFNSRWKWTCRAPLDPKPEFVQVRGQMSRPLVSRKGWADAYV